MKADSLELCEQELRMVSTVLLQSDISPIPLKVVNEELEVVHCNAPGMTDTNKKDETAVTTENDMNTIPSPTSAGLFPEIVGHVDNHTAGEREESEPTSLSSELPSESGAGVDVNLEKNQESKHEKEASPPREKRAETEGQAESFNFSAFRAQLEKNSKNSGVIVNMDDYRMKQINEKKRNNQKKKEATGILNAGVTATSNLDDYRMKQRDTKRKNEEKKKEAASILNAGVAVTSNLDNYHMKQIDEKKRNNEKKKEATSILNAGVATTSNLDDYHMKQIDEKKKDEEKKKEAASILKAGVAVNLDDDDYYVKQRDEKRKNEEKKKEAVSILNAGVTATSNLDNYHMKQNDERKRDEEKKKEATSILNAGVATTSNLDDYHMKQQNEKRKDKEKEEEAANILNKGVVVTSTLDDYYMRQRDEKRKNKQKEEEAANILRSYSGEKLKTKNVSASESIGNDVNQTSNPYYDKHGKKQNSTGSIPEKLDLLTPPDRRYFNLEIFKCLLCKN